MTPCPNVLKKLFINYKINNYIIEEIYNENLDKPIIIDFESKYCFDFKGFDTYNNNMFENILINITYNDEFIQNSKSFLLNKNEKINVLHLRLEEDGILFWSKINNMTPDFLENI